MIKIFRYYYFRLYSYYSGGMIPFFSTLMLIIAFMYINAMTIMNIVEVITGIKFMLPTRQTNDLFSYLWPLLIVLPVCGFCYYYFKILGNHDVIFNEFANESKRNRLLHGMYVILYFLISISSFIFTLWLRQIIRDR